MKKEKEKEKKKGKKEKRKKGKQKTKQNNKKTLWHRVRIVRAYVKFAIGKIERCVSLECSNVISLSLLPTQTCLGAFLHLFWICSIPTPLGPMSGLRAMVSA